MGFLQKTRHSHARPNVPALVQVAALAIIMIRCLDVLMIMNTLGPRGMGEFIHRSAQTWNLTLVFLSSLMLVFIEIYCVLAGKGAQLGALGIFSYADHRRQLSVGRLAGLWLSGAIQHSRRLPPRDFPFLSDAKIAGHAGALPALCSRLQSAVLPPAIMCIIAALVILKVFICSAYSMTPDAAAPVSG